ncbi:MAG TPA: hypothetical protein VL947_07580 [Cytophagales bacterium]|nr:hypothetical protein [Cytophagales bacterium]
MDTLHFASGGQLLGLSYLKNEGDLNGDGNDEVSYVVKWADWSSRNSCHIVTYKNKRWVVLYSFSIAEWQLPELPKTNSKLEYLRTEDNGIHKSNDTSIIRQEEELRQFKGLVRKIDNNKFSVIYTNDSADLDTMIVDLIKIKK